MAPTDDRLPERPDFRSPFDAPDPAAWRRAAQQALGEDQPWSKLRPFSHEDLELEPLYSEPPSDEAAQAWPGMPPLLRAGRPAGTALHGWDVRQRHELGATDLPGARNRLLKDLERGATSLQFRSAPQSAADWARLLDGVHLEMIRIALDHDGTKAARQALLQLYDDRGIADDAIAVDLMETPWSGDHSVDRSGLAQRVGAAVGAAAAQAHRPAVRAVAIDAGWVHESGGDAAQQLAFALAAGVELLRAGDRAGVALQTIGRSTLFRFALSPRFFLETAKLRAARRLWARVLELSGVDAAEHPAAMEVRLGRREITRRAPSVNMLRHTAACFAGVLGGADAIVSVPWDEKLGAASAEAHRLAGQTQWILAEESHLHRCIDPAGGSWYVESLTEALCQAAWSGLQRIESAGGCGAALADGSLRQAIDERARRRLNRIITRKDTLVGINAFADLTEPPTNPTTATQGDKLPTTAPTSDQPFQPARPFEQLRDRADAYRLKHGAAPTLFAAGLGQVRDHRPQLGFARDLFAAGGWHLDVAVGDADAIVEAYTKGAQPVVVLCGNPKILAAAADSLGQRLRAAGARRIIVTVAPDADGRPAHGADGWVARGCDAIAAIEAVWAAHARPTLEEGR